MEIKPRALERDRSRVVCCSDIFALLNPVLVGFTRYPTVCLICARKKSAGTLKVKRQPHVLVISADPKKKKAACRASYNASPEKKRAASHFSYRADREEKRAASQVASRASGLPPRVPLFKAYL